MLDLLVAAARPWHFWIAVALTAGAVLATIATLVGYLIKVSATKYPRD
ncbi:MAG TPA: hypothetical protein VGA13_12415 [Acidimicrobiales bacterium]|jgi:hypothetical protein